MKVLAVVLAIIILLVISEHFNEKSRLEKLKTSLIKQWGKLPQKKYNDEIIDAISYHYQIMREKDKENVYIDDITWHDIDMQGMYEMINNTSSGIGNEYLYYVLRKLCKNSDELLERKQIIDMFTNDKNSRIEIQMIMESIGQNSKISISKYMENIKNITMKNCIIHYIQAFMLLGSVALIFFGFKFGIILTLAMMLINVATYYSAKAETEPYLIFFSYVIMMSKAAEKLTGVDNEVVKNYKEEIKDINKSIRKLRKRTTMLTASSVSGGFADTVMDYVKMLFHVDITTFYSMLNVMQSNLDGIKRLYDIIGTFDSMCAVASFREYLNYYCEPQLENAKKADGKFVTKYQVLDVYHPFIKNPVPNTIDEHGCVLLTGSNASGKSTFIKTLALNAVLSQTIYTSISKEYRGCFYNVMTSMALKDNLVNNESYYMVEIKSLKRIIDSNTDEMPVLCFVDEVLRGTNTLERIAASSQILASMAECGFMSFAATHDIEMTQILSRYYTNYHFQETVVDNDVVFDYLLQKGPATSRNAIKLLRIIGYSNDIINEATNRANNFLETNNWNIL